MILSGWKEVADYLRCGVRTVQRWEKTGLPVHRPVASKRSHVVAYSEELDWWVRDHQPHHSRPYHVALTIEHAKQLCDDARMIRAEVRARLQTLREEVASLRTIKEKRVNLVLEKAALGGVRVAMEEILPELKRGNEGHSQRIESDISSASVKECRFGS